MQVCLIFSLTENVSLKDIILLLGNQRRCVLTPDIIVLRYQKSNFHASNLLHKYTEFESFSLPLKEHHNESAHIFRMYSVLFSHCFNDKLKKKKMRIKLYLNLIAMTSLTQNLAPIHQNAINALASDPYACLGAIVFLTTYASILKKSLSHFDL